MPSPALPPALALLSEQPDRAADAALVEVVPYLDAPLQQYAVEKLLERAHPPSLAVLVGRYRDYPGALRSLLVAHAERLSPGLRIAVESTVANERFSAIEIIVEGRATTMAYLLADALRRPCPRTQALAAEGLRRIVVEERGAAADYVVGALQSAVHHWEAHAQPAVLEAALRLIDRVEPAIRKKLEERRCKAALLPTLRDAMNRWLEHTRDPALAGAVVRALGIPALQAAAGRAIRRTEDISFLRAVLREGWLLADARVAAGCRRIGHGPWVQQAVGAVSELTGPASASGVRFLSVAAGQADRKIEWLRELAGAGHLEIRRAVLCELIRDDSEAAQRLLTIIAVRPGDDVARMAARELRRRRIRSGTWSGSSTPATGSDSASLLHAAFEHYWTSCDDLAGDEQISAARMVRDGVPDLPLRLRAKLARSETLERARALRVAAALGVVKALEAPICRAVYDPDALVRSLAVRLLPSLPGAATLRMLREKINDPDGRVQANAIEAMDRLDREDRVAWTVPKLASPDCRVRANAIRSLLRAQRPEAGEALLDMLDDQAPAHRLSALWVVENLRLQTAGRRVQTLRKTDPDARVRRRAERVRRLLNQDQPSRLSEGSPGASESDNNMTLPGAGIRTVERSERAPFMASRRAPLRGSSTQRGSW